MCAYFCSTLLLLNALLLTREALFFLLVDHVSLLKRNSTLNRFQTKFTFYLYKMNEFLTVSTPFWTALLFVCCNATSMCGSYCNVCVFCMEVWVRVPYRNQLTTSTHVYLFVFITIRFYITYLVLHCVFIFLDFVLFVVFLYLYIYIPRSNIFWFFIYFYIMFTMTRTV